MDGLFAGELALRWDGTASVCTQLYGVLHICRF